MLLKHTRNCLSVMLCCRASELVLFHVAMFLMYATNCLLVMLGCRSCEIVSFHGVSSRMWFKDPQRQLMLLISGKVLFVCHEGSRMGGKL